jgi:hypothetical protein
MSGSSDAVLEQVVGRGPAWLRRFPNPPLHPATRRLLNALLVALVVGTALAWTAANITVYNAPNNLMEPFTDAMTYRAAGDRLNIGHELYRLVPGDLPVLTIPGLYSAPLLSPPPIAVLWRPLAAVEWGMALWVAASWVVLLGTVLYVVVKVGLPGVLLALLLSHAIGEQLAVANFNAFMPALYILMWKYRDRAVAGVLIGFAASIKLSPLAMTGWLAGGRRWPAVGATFATLAFMLALGVLGAGIGSYVAYLGTLSGNQPTELSLAGWTGLSWTPYAFLVVGSLASWLIGGRWPRASFVVALLASVLGTPALYASGLVSLLALAAPWTDSAPGLQFGRPTPGTRDAPPL